MTLTPEVIQIVIQGGAVGILLVFGVMGYRLARLAIVRVSDFVTNHLAHNTEAVKEGTEVMRGMSVEIRSMSEKLDKD